VDPWLLLLLFIAIAIGWWLGRRSAAAPDAGNNTSPVHPDYYRGLNYLLSDQPSGNLDSFISSLEVNSDTLDTHLAVGNLMRRKGEVDSAIRIHQNLLSRPSLHREHLHRAHLELARDFISAGLLDRAERLLEDLVTEAPEQRGVARRHLLEIYQDEKEWGKAIEAARALRPKKTLLKPPAPQDKGIVIALAHYCCELAEQTFAINDVQGARAYLKKAIDYDGQCVRASMLLAEIEFKTEHFQRAIKVLHRVKTQDITLVPETVALLRSTYQQLGNQRGFFDYLNSCQNVYPSASIMLALVDDVQQREGDVAAAEFMGVEMKRRPSLRGLSRLVELHIANSKDRAKDNLTLLQLLIEQLLSSKSHYQCQHCGFSAKQLRWLCPGCKVWGEMKPLRGVDGD
jgi:lipopolysaccharide biosynthesis regulator YciM